MKLLMTSIEQGLIFSILAMGVIFTNKILNMADLSVEGSFPFGAFIFAKFIIMGVNPFISLVLAFLFGTLAGLFTGILYTKFKINSLLSGILTMNILYSINLRINDRANVPLYGYNMVFNNENKLLILIILVLAIKILIDLFLKTELGYLLIATGDNESLVRGLGKKSDRLKILALMLSNGFIALSGALMANMQGVADATMGKGTLVIALAGIIIGDTLFKDRAKMTSRVIVGSIVYKIIGGIAIDLGLKPTDLSAINASIVILFLLYNNFFNDFMVNRKIKRKLSDKNA